MALNRLEGSRSSLTWRWLATAAWLGLLVGVVLEWRAISELRHESALLRALVESVGADAADAASGQEQLRKERREFERLLAEAQRSREEDKLELQRLLGEIRQLRESMAHPASAVVRGGASPAAAASGTPSPVPTRGATPTTPNDTVRRLGLVIGRRDPRALDELAEVVAGMQTMDAAERAAVAADVRQIFEALGVEAGAGNAAALDMIWQATRTKRLQGFAVAALGQAAGQGSEDALKPLLDPEGYQLLRSSAIAALKPAADAGTARAIEALAATASDPEQRALWLLAAQGLATAASAGNATAIDGLTLLATAPVEAVQREAVLALEAAARGGQSRAEDALRSLGWR